MRVLPHQAGSQTTTSRSPSPPCRTPSPKRECESCRRPELRVSNTLLEQLGKLGPKETRLARGHTVSGKVRTGPQAPYSLLLLSPHATSRLPGMTAECTWGNLHSAGSQRGSTSDKPWLECRHSRAGDQEASGCFWRVWCCGVYSGHISE